LKSGVSKIMDEKLKSIAEEDLNRLIEMAWEDRTPFEAIKFQFGFSQGEVIKVMRSQLKRSSFNLWRKRVNQGDSIKHLKKRPDVIDRFKCTRQRSISFNKISKR
jgi:uncharacterized protein (TIGR03643 family)